MRHRPLRTSCLVALTLVLAACSKEPDKQAPELQLTHPPEPTNVSPNAEPSTSAAFVPDKAVLLAIKWPPGNRYVYRLTLDQWSTNTFSNLDQVPVEHQRMGVTYALTALEPGTATGGELEFTFLAFDLEIRMADQVVMSFSSAAPSEGADAGVTAAFARLIGTNVRLRTDSAGAVQQVLNLEAWAEGVVGERRGIAEQMLLQQFSEGFFRQVGEFARGLPASPVQPGSSWPYHGEVPAGALGRIVVDSMITFKEVVEGEQRLAVIEAEGLLSGGTPGNPPSGSMELEHGTITSTAWFDPGLGALVESAGVQGMVVRGELADSASENGPPVVFTSTMRQSVNLNLIELRQQGETKAIQFGASRRAAGAAE